jgi:virginiamycin A acetyltransferase
MLAIKQFLKKIILILYWKWRNYKDKLEITNYKLSRKTLLGKRTKIRNRTEIGNISLGDYSYISGPGSYIEEAIIGKYCSIARQVVIGVSGHNYNWLTTSPIITSKAYGFIDNDIKVPQKEKPVIGNDVWVGMNVIIMRGVTIGDGAVIAAGSVVTTDIAPYSIAGGIPAKHIRYRFSKEIIESLLMIEWWNWPEEKIRQNAHLFYDIQKFIQKHI